MKSKRENRIYQRTGEENGERAVILCSHSFSLSLSPFCPNKIIEDEIHFLFLCPLYKHLRNDFFTYLSIQCQLELTHLSITDKIAAIFQQNNSKIHFLLGTFVSKCFEYRDEKLSEHKSSKQIIKYYDLAFDKFAIILLYTTTIILMTGNFVFCYL